MATTSQVSGSAVISYLAANRPFIAKSPDISLIGLSANDIVQAIPVPAGVVITCVDSVIVTASSVASSAFGIGDGDNATGYDAAVAADAAAGTRARSAVGTDTYATTGKLYSAADTIDLKLTTAASSPTAGAVRLYAYGYYA